MTEPARKTYTIPMPSSSLLDEIRSSHRFVELMKREMDRATADLIWAWTDDDENRHIGPVHHPNRSDLYEANRRLAQDRYFRSLGRPRGPYRKMKKPPRNP